MLLSIEASKNQKEFKIESRATRRLIFRTTNYRSGVPWALILVLIFRKLGVRGDDVGDAESIESKGL